jgi:hypothetical protein
MRVLLRRVWLFVRIVWRQWEGPESGIPEPYRLSQRISARTAWEVAVIVWP